MKVHADVGADILRSIDFPYPVEPIVRHHHEQWDGSGYPAGLRGQEIPIGARILSVVDCYDALTSDRPYRSRMSRQQAEQVLRDRRGKAYDPWIVDKFISLLDDVEAEDTSEERAENANTLRTEHTGKQFEAIAVTTAEERALAELRRDMTRAGDITSATDLLLRHTKRLVPVDTLAFSMPKSDSNELAVVACSGIGAASIAGMRTEMESTSQGGRLLTLSRC